MILNATITLGLQTFIVGIVLGIFIYRIFFNKKATKKLKDVIYNPIVKATYDNRIMTIEYYNGQTMQYEGTCTVWHSYPMMKRAGTLKEGELCDIWAYIKRHGNPYPDAHVTK